MTTNLFSISIVESGNLTAITGSSTWAILMSKIADAVLVKKVKTRKTRVWTDEARAAFHAKMVAARLKKASAEGKNEPTITKEKVEPIIAKVNSKPDPNSLLVSKPTKSSKTVSVGRKPKSLPIPRTGHKVKIKSASH
jgi:hypothetical protein